jgi:hypothetical protein
MRTVYDDVGDVLRLVNSLTDEDLARTDFGSYTAGRLPGYPGADHGVPLRSRARQPARPQQHRDAGSGGRRTACGLRPAAFRQGDRFRFWGGAILEVVGGRLGPRRSRGRWRAGTGSRGARARFTPRPGPALRWDGHDALLRTVALGVRHPPRGLARTGQERVPGQHVTGGCLPRSMPCRSGLAPVPRRSTMAARRGMRHARLRSSGRVACPE